MGNLIPRNGRLLSDGNPAGWIYSEIIADGVTSDPIEIKPNGKGVSNITCTLIAGTNTGKFQITTSSDDDVKADTATWQDWKKGDSIGTVTDVIVGQVTGVRGVSISGEVKIEVVI